jgi:hypothetical protein
MAAQLGLRRFPQMCFIIKEARLFGTSIHLSMTSIIRFASLVVP